MQDPVFILIVIVGVVSLVGTQLRRAARLAWIYWRILSSPVGNLVRLARSATAIQSTLQVTLGQFSSFAVTGAAIGLPLLWVATKNHLIPLFVGATVVVCTISGIFISYPVFKRLHLNNLPPDDFQRVHLFNGYMCLVQLLIGFVLPILAPALWLATALSASVVGPGPDAYLLGVVGTTGAVLLYAGAVHAGYWGLSLATSVLHVSMNACFSFFALVFLAAVAAPQLDTLALILQLR